VCAPFFYHLAHGSRAFLGLLEDDYFYYAIIADKFVSLGKLTFDGITLTNGFHPLWFAVIVLLRALAGGLNGSFYVMLSVCFLASMITAYELARLLARSLGASATLAPVIGLVFCVATDKTMSSGMETAVDIPLLLWLVLEVSRARAIPTHRAIRLGLVASVAILARLDIAMVVPIAFLGWLVFARPTHPAFIRVLVPFCAAGVAVPIYAAFNLLEFGSIMPVSALSKQLVTRFGINLSYLRAIATWTAYGKTGGVLLAVGVVAVVVLRRRRAQGEALVRAEALFAGGLALAFACTLFFVNTLNGWMYFSWYSYPFAPALVAALTFTGTIALPRVEASWRTRASAAAVVGAAIVASFQAASYFVVHGPLWSVGDNGLLAMSLELADRMRTREGVCGMGAVAGFSTYAMNRPVVQLEGLVADRAMVEHIRREDDLRSVLAAYHVDYFVVSLPAHMEKRDGCYSVSEPNPEWAGKRVATMQGSICAEPVEHFETRIPPHRWSLFSTLDTYVFDARDLRRPPGTS